MKRNILLLIFLFTNHLVWSQTSGFVILDKESKQAVPYVNICWQNIHNSKDKGYAITDFDGKASIKTEGLVKLAISRIGYKSYIDTLKLSAENIIYLSEDILNLEQIVVTGTRTPKRLANVPVQTSVIQRREITKAGSVAPLETLQDNIPGIVSSPNAMGNNIRIKGLSSYYILFLVDGERLPSEGASGNVNLDQIDINNIERIEVVNGAASALYGSNAVGGVINFITKKPKHRFEGTFNQTLTNFNNQRSRLSLAVKLDKFSLQASGFRNKADEYANNFKVSSNEYLDYGTNLKIGYKPTERATLSMTGRIFRHETFNLADNYFATTHALEKNIALRAKGALVSRDSSNTMAVNVNYSKFFNYSVLEKDDDRKRENTTISYMSARFVDTYMKTEKWELVGGAEMNRQESFSRNLFGDTPTTKSINDFNLFGQFQYEIFDNFDAVLGARYIYNSQFESAFTPKFSLMYKYNNFTFRGGIGSAFRAPDVKELYYNFYHRGGGGFMVFGNADLLAEKGLYNSLSVEFTKGSFNTSISGYYNHIKDKIAQYTVLSETGENNRYYTNVGSTTLQGFDINASLVIIKQLVLKTTYSFCDAVDDKTNLQLFDNVKHSATASLTWNGKIAHSPFSLQFAGRMNSPILYQFRAIDEEGQTVTVKRESKSYNIWKIVLVKPFRVKAHSFEFTAKIDNVFNFTEKAYVNPGRQYLFGFKYSFK